MGGMSYDSGPIRSSATFRRVGGVTMLICTTSRRSLPKDRTSIQLHWNCLSQWPQDRTCVVHNSAFVLWRVQFCASKVAGGSDLGMAAARRYGASYVFFVLVL